ncbi:hypothetical protein [Pseudaminobacter salicylatoxidans]|uniref:hypothetical protein n=1 Tax=Pseudaminobacter salicylatoxidans TaxID=93369 RepID=UPI00047447B1|nr:hypothetical protein [Pseudaminobacter salicylatoxidans]
MQFQDDLIQENLKIGGRSAIWQRYEEATVCQRRPADPMDPGDAADLSIMGLLQGFPVRVTLPFRRPFIFPMRHLRKTI